MAWYEFIWTDESDGNIEYIAQHGVSQDEFKFVFVNYESETTSHSSGRPMRFGRTESGRLIAVVFEWIEQDLSVLPFNAFDVPEGR